MNTEVFETYEINRSPFWRRFSTFLGFSIALHAIFLASVLYVPTLRSMFHIATMFGDTEWVDEEYGRINIEDRATIVNLTNSDKFAYPAGYFSATPLLGPPPPPVPDAVFLGSVEAEKEKPTPTPSETPTPEALPTASPSATPETEVAENRTTTEDEITKLAAEGKVNEQVAEDALKKKVEETGLKRPGTVNKKPFLDLLARAREMKEKGELSLEGAIQMTAEGTLNPDGSLSNVKVIKKAGDPKLEELAKELINALSQSHVLSFLTDVKHLTLDITLDDQNLTASARTSVSTETFAKEMANGYSGMLVIQRIRKSGRDEGEIWKNTTVSAKGKDVIISFQMPRSTAGAMLTKYVPKEG
jgi:hypothetical protein